MTDHTQIEKWTCVGVVIGPHGIKGDFKIRSFCEIPSSIRDYNPLRVEGYPELVNLVILSGNGDTFKVKSKKIIDRESVELIKGKLLFACKNRLPKTGEDEYYFTDLIGMTVKNRTKQPVGKVKNVENYGAGTILEISNNKTLKTIFLPFKKTTIPIINLKERYIVVDRLPKEF